MTNVYDNTFDCARGKVASGKKLFALHGGIKKRLPPGINARNLTNQFLRWIYPSEEFIGAEEVQLRKLNSWG